MATQKREKKSIWVPKTWLDWARPYFEENKQYFLKIGVKSETELYWRSADMGREEMEELIDHLKKKKKPLPKHEGVA